VRSAATDELGAAAVVVVVVVAGARRPYAPVFVLPFDGRVPPCDGRA
jgi:hypothetical protein